MRDIERIKVILERLEKLWKKYPDLRLGQLITNAINDIIVLYYVEDENLLDCLEDYYAD